LLRPADEGRVTQSSGSRHSVRSSLWGCCQVCGSTAPRWGISSHLTSSGPPGTRHFRFWAAAHRAPNVRRVCPRGRCERNRGARVRETLSSMSAARAGAERSEARLGGAGGPPRGRQRWGPTRPGRRGPRRTDQREGTAAMGGTTGMTATAPQETPRWRNRARRPHTRQRGTTKCVSPPRQATGRSPAAPVGIGTVRRPVRVAPPGREDTGLQRLD
jgi:hypothetical protein